MAILGQCKPSLFIAVFLHKFSFSPAAKFCLSVKARVQCSCMAFSSRETAFCLIQTKVQLCLYREYNVVKGVGEG